MGYDTFGIDDTPLVNVGEYSLLDWIDIVTKGGDNA